MQEDRKFIPAPEYKNLKIQALALHRMLLSTKSYNKHLLEDYDKLLKEVTLLRLGEVESLRNENEILTNILDKYENR